MYILSQPVNCLLQSLSASLFSIHAFRIQRMTDHPPVLHFIVSPLSWPVITPSLFYALISLFHTYCHSIVVLVLSNLLIDIRWHNRRLFLSCVQPLLSLIEWTRRWSGAIDSAVRERGSESLHGLCFCSCGWDGAVAFTCWVKCGGWPDGEKKGGFINNEEVRVDFLLLPQLIKDLTYWIWQREEMSGTTIGIRRENTENRAKAYWR